MADRQGRLHVDELLDELEPHELIEWRAAKGLVPLDDGPFQTGIVAAKLHNNFEVYKAMKAGRTTIPESRWRTPEDFIKGRRQGRTLSSIEMDEPSIAVYQASQERAFLGHATDR